MKWAVGLAVAVVAVGCSSTSTHRGATPTTPLALSTSTQGSAATTPVAPSTAATEETPPTGHCGTERWSVKTGQDPQATQVSTTTVEATSIAALVVLPAPHGPTVRVPPVETTVYRVSATVVAYKLETDSDDHLVLSDGGHTMIAEIPSTACMGTSPFRAEVAATRAAADTRLHPTGAVRTASLAVTVTGVGFFDRIHGQLGVAPNGIELHPVLALQFG